MLAHRNRKARRRGNSQSELLVKSPLTNSYMKIGLSFRTLSVLLFAGLSLPIVALSQEAEKQKIIDVITGELDAWYKKDRAKWTDAIVHSNDFILTSAS